MDSIQWVTDFAIHARRKTMRGRERRMVEEGVEKEAESCISETDVVGFSRFLRKDKNPVAPTY